MTESPFQLVDGELPHYRWEVAGAVGIFTLREGGGSAGPYHSLNLGFNTDDDPAAVALNRERAAALLWGDRPVRWVSQVHGTAVVIDPGVDGVEGDAIVSTDGAPAMVTVADCVPVLLAGSWGVAAMHVGWRGAAGGIVSELLSSVRGKVWAAIGPCIGPCCFTVEEDVASRFERGHLCRAADGSRTAVDLQACVRDQLLDGGARVDVLAICTSCDERFFSHRRDRGTTGRQAGVVWATHGDG